jgi:CRISPR-associated exonuclease Cas4
MEAGSAAHHIERKKALRRSLQVVSVESGTRRFDVPFVAPKLGLSGIIDEVIDVSLPKPTLIPVDYKLSKQPADHFQLQVVAYAMILEECLGKPVERGYIYLIPVKKSVEVLITTRLRNQVKTALIEMHQIAQTEHMPPPTDRRQKCVDCEFHRFCNDVF